MIGSEFGRLKPNQNPKLRERGELQFRTRELARERPKIWQRR
jgi:hypothetical protein